MPRLFLARAVLDGLTAGQLSAALLHERAHQKSHDNLKRLLLLLAPDALPWVSLTRNLERTWARYAEWAADDGAVAGDSGRSLALAAAVVRVARMSPRTASVPLQSALTENPCQLASRVDRLLRNAPVIDERPFLSMLAAGLGVGIAVVGLSVIQPGAMQFSHGILERLVR